MVSEKTRAIVRGAEVHHGGGAFPILLLFLLAVLFLPAKAGAQTDAAGLLRVKMRGCHGKTGDGNTPVGKGIKLGDLRSAEVQKQTDAELVTIVCCGKGKMPGYQSKLTDGQITQFVGYMRTLAAKK